MAAFRFPCWFEFECWSLYLTHAHCWMGVVAYAAFHLTGNWKGTCNE
jgi:hypothetical protein